jgi:hypothetical protein
MPDPAKTRYPVAALLLALVALFPARLLAQDADLAALAWLAGAWESRTPDGSARRAEAP